MKERKQVWTALKKAGLHDFHHAFMSLTLLKFNGLDATLEFVAHCGKTPQQQPLFDLDQTTKTTT